MEAARAFRGGRWATAFGIVLFVLGLALPVTAVATAATPLFAVPAIVVGLVLLSGGWYHLRVGQSFVAVRDDGLVVRNGWNVSTVLLERVERVTIQERPVTLLRPFALRALGAPPTCWDVVIGCVDGTSLDVLALRGWPEQGPFYRVIGQSRASVESAVAQLGRSIAERSP